MRPTATALVLLGLLASTAWAAPKARQAALRGPACRPTLPGGSELRGRPRRRTAPDVCEPLPRCRAQADGEKARGMAGWAKDKVGDVVENVRDKIGSGERWAGPRAGRCLPAASAQAAQRALTQCWLGLPCTSRAVSAGWALR